MEKSHFIALVEEITSARVTDRTGDVPQNSGARTATIPSNGIEVYEKGLVGGVLSNSGTTDEYRPALMKLASVFAAGDHVYLDGFQSYGGENEPALQKAFGHKIAFFITLPTE